MAEAVVSSGGTEKLEFYVNVDLFLSDSSDMADIVLPAATFLNGKK